MRRVMRHRATADRNETEGGLRVGGEDRQAPPGRKGTPMHQKGGIAPQGGRRTGQRPPERHAAAGGAGLPAAPRGGSARGPGAARRRRARRGPGFRPAPYPRAKARPAWGGPAMAVPPFPAFPPAAGKGGKVGIAMAAAPSGAGTFARERRRLGPGGPAAAAAVPRPHPPPGCGWPRPMRPGRAPMELCLRRASRIRRRQKRISAATFDSAVEDHRAQLAPVAHGRNQAQPSPLLADPDQGRPAPREVLARRLLPARAAVLGDDLEMPVAPCRRGLGRRARHPAVSARSRPCRSAPRSIGVGR